MHLLFYQSSHQGNSWSVYVTYKMTSYIIDFKFTFLFKFGGLGTFKQLEQGYEIEKLHVFVGSK